MHDTVSNALTLMVVDDNVDSAIVMSLFLETLGHTVSIEHSAHGALVRAREQRPRIIFMDIGLPDMDGYELALRLRAMPETAQSVLVAATGYAQPQHKARAIEAGFAYHLVKPVPLELLFNLLRNYTNQSRDDCVM